MKARVKATGDIIEVIRDTHHIHFDYYDGKMLYKAKALEFIDDDNPDYWTRLEHQYAGMAIQGILANIDLLMSIVKKKADDYPVKYTVTEFAQDCAHALVEKYKEKEERK